MKKIEQRIAADPAYRKVAGARGIVREPIRNLVTAGSINSSGEYVKSEESDSGPTALMNAASFALFERNLQSLGVDATNPQNWRRSGRPATIQSVESDSGDKTFLEFTNMNSELDVEWGIIELKVKPAPPSETKPGTKCRVVFQIDGSAYDCVAKTVWTTSRSTVWIVMLGEIQKR